MALKYVCEVCGKDLTEPHIKLSINVGKGYSGWIDTPPDPHIEEPIPTKSFHFCGSKCIAKWFEKRMWKSYPQDNQEDW